MRRALLTSLLCVAALAAAPALASAKTVTASSGPVSAQFSYQGSVDAGFSGLSLTITRNGSTAYQAPVSSKLCGDQCWPGADNRAKGPLRVLDLDGDGEPEVLLDLYSGGNHCCSLSQVFRWDAATSSYVKVEQVWGDPGYTLSTLAGAPAFVSADDRFAYAFAAYAFSGLPVQIWRWRTGRFVDVTKRFPATIRADARRWLKLFRKGARQKLGLGYLAAWAADERLLGARRTVDRELASALRHHQLGSLPGWPSGRRFETALRHFLARDGYR